MGLTPLRQPTGAATRADTEIANERREWREVTTVFDVRQPELPLWAQETER